MKKSPRLKRIYADVVRGVSLTKVNSFPLYIKHPNSVEAAALEYKYEELVEIAVAANIQTAADKEKYLIENGLWDESKNREIINWKEFLKSMAITKSKLLLKAEINEIGRQIVEGENTLLGLEIEKREKLGETAETYAAHKFNDYIVTQSFFLDPEFEKKYFTEEVFDEVTDIELQAFIDVYNETMGEYREQILKKVAIQPFFQGYFSLADKDIHKFYGKPVVDLSHYQMNLFSLGSYYQDALREYSGQATEEMLENPDAFVEKVIQKKNVDKLLASDNTNGPSSRSIVGMSAEELKAMGIHKDEMASMSKFVGKSFEEIAKDFNS